MNKIEEHEQNEFLDTYLEIQNLVQSTSEDIMLALRWVETREEAMESINSLVDKNRKVWWLKSATSLLIAIEDQITAKREQIGKGQTVIPFRNK